MKVTGQQMVDALTDFVNGATQSDMEEFAKAMMREHRTLQQETFDLFIMTMEEWAKVPEIQTDARNSFAVRKSKEIMEKIFE